MAKPTIPAISWRSKPASLSSIYPLPVSGSEGGVNGLGVIVGRAVFVGEWVAVGVFVGVLVFFTGVSVFVGVFSGVLVGVSVGVAEDSGVLVFVGFGVAVLSLVAVSGAWSVGLGNVGNGVPVGDAIGVMPLGVGVASSP